MCRQILIELNCGIVAHSLLSAFHSRYLDYYSQISSGLNGNGICRYLKSEDICRLLLETEPVINLILIPVLELDDKIYLFAFLYGTDTEYTPYIDDAYAAKLHIMLDYLRRGADERFLRNTLYFHGVICDETMTALYQLISTPPNAIAHSTGLVKQNEMMKIGLIMGIIGLVLGYAVLFTIGEMGLLKP